MQTTMRKEGENQLQRRLELTIFTIPRIICSAALKSAIAPSRSGRMVRMPGGSLPSIPVRGCSYCKELVGLVLDGDDRRLVYYDFVVMNYDGIGCAKDPSLSLV